MPSQAVARGGDIVFVGNARCYHTMDWYRTIKGLCPLRRVRFLTDVIDSEGHARIVTADDDLVHLCNVDWALLPKQSHLGNLWRNAVKALMIPVQVLHLRRFVRTHPDAVLHAHTMYYMCLCWLAGARFIGTPQGSEVLVRPNRSRVYRWFASRALAAARPVTVDSTLMQAKVREVSGAAAALVQNGIDVATLAHAANAAGDRRGIVSIRGMTPLYRIREILAAWRHSGRGETLRLIYPFWDDTYKAGLDATGDGLEDLGRLSRPEMYELLAATRLVVSIPLSDSSPRSVYEAIFCGCCVAATYAPWIDALPACMRARLFIVNLEDADWLERALAFAADVVRHPYVPSEQAMEQFDQRRTLERACARFYGGGTLAAV